MTDTPTPIPPTLGPDPSPRDRLLSLSLDQLALACRIDHFRGVGPGGQKRNKTETAVRVTLRDYEACSAFDDTSRSQHQNRDHALRKLRLNLALALRQPPVPWSEPIPSIHSPNWEKWLAQALDALESTDYKLADAAKLLGCSTSKLSRELSKSPAAWQFVNTQRQNRNLPKLLVN